jgi:hypothetical protein
VLADSLLLELDVLDGGFELVDLGLAVTTAFRDNLP